MIKSYIEILLSSIYHKKNLKDETK